MNSQPHTVVLLFVGCASASACMGTSADSEGAVEMQRESKFATSANLPLASVDAICDEERPGVTEWVLAADSIVLGTLESVKPVTDRILSLENAAEPTPLAECDLEQFYPALEVTLSDTETLRGKPLPANLTLVVGIEANERWDSPPRLNPATNEIYFPGTPSAFAKGARVGASLFEEPSTGELLTLTTPLFSVEPGNVVEFAATGPCIPSPPGLNRIPLSAFRNELGNVQATAAAQSEADDLRDALGMALPTDAMAEKHLASKCLPTDHVEPVQEKDPEEEGGLAF